MNNITLYTTKFIDTLRYEGAKAVATKSIRFIRTRILQKHSTFKHIPPTAHPDQFLSAELRHHTQIAKRSKISLYAVIPSYEDYKVLEKCIASIERFGQGLVQKIIISDDFSPSSEHQEFLKKILERLNSIPIEVIKSNINKGFSANVNRGLSKVPQNTDILLLNSDTEVHEGAIDAMLSTARASIAVVGARLTYPDGSIQHGGGFRNFINLDWFEHLYRNRAAKHTPALVSSPCLFCTGAALYIPSEARVRIGDFDENFKMGFEDVDYCLRAWDCGIPVIYCGAAQITHHESITRGRKIGPREAESKAYFWKKYQKKFEDRSVTDTSGKINVVFILKDTGVGGGHRVIFNYANHLAAKDFNVEIWSCSQEPNWYSLDHRIKHRFFPDFKNMEAALTPLNAIKIATWWETAQTVWKASLTHGIPVWLSQDIESSYYSSRDTNSEMRALASYRPEFVYLINYKWIKTVFEEDFRYQTNYIGLGIDVDNFYFDNSSRLERSILVCARGEKLKGFDFTKSIIRELIPHGFQITAYGVDKTLISDIPQVKFIYKPTDEELKQLFNTHQYFLQTSIHEGLSLPPLEAMSCECIPIVTDAVGNRDYIKNHENCLVINRNLEESVSTIRKLKWNEVHSKLLSGMQNTVKEYDWKNCYDRLTDLFIKISANPIYGKTKY